jgi:hypothetical protein
VAAYRDLGLRGGPVVALGLVERVGPGMDLLQICVVPMSA